METTKESILSFFKSFKGKLFIVLIIVAIIFIICDVRCSTNDTPNLMLLIIVKIISLILPIIITICIDNYKASIDKNKEINKLIKDYNKKARESKNRLGGLIENIENLNSYIINRKKGIDKQNKDSLLEIIKCSETQSKLCIKDWENLIDSSVEENIREEIPNIKEIIESIEQGLSNLESEKAT